MPSRPCFAVLVAALTASSMARAEPPPPKTPPAPDDDGTYEVRQPAARRAPRIPVFENRFSDGGRLDGAAEGARLRSYRIRIATPIPLIRTGGLRLMGRLGYQWDRFRFRSADVSELTPEDLDLHAFQADVTMMTSLSKSWTFAVGAGATMASDMRSLSSDAWIPSARAQWTYRSSPELSWVLGLMVSRNTNALVDLPVLALPSLGVFYRPEGLPLELDVMLPAFSEVRVPLPLSLEVYARVNLSGASGHVAERTETEAHFYALTEVDASLGVRFLAADWLDFGLAFGFSPLRQLQLTLPGESESVQTTLSGRPFISTHIGLRL